MPALPRSPCFRCRHVEPNRRALDHYLAERRRAVTLGRSAKPAVERWLNGVCTSESFMASTVVDANDPWVDELVELLPAGPERLFLYADISALVEFYAGLSGESQMRVCFALGTPEKTEPILEGQNQHWLACYYAGPDSHWVPASVRRSELDLESKPGDLLLAQRDDLRCESLGQSDTGQRLVMRIMVDH